MSSIPALSSISNLSDLIGSNKTSTDTDNSLPFQSLYNVVDTQNEVDKQALLLATGQTDDVHNLSIASTQASLSLDLLVELRNKSIDAYNQLMQMSV